MEVLSLGVKEVSVCLLAKIIQMAYIQNKGKSKESGFVLDPLKIRVATGILAFLSGLEIHLFLMLKNIILKLSTSIQ